MPLPSAPPITLAQVCAEFGAPVTTPLTEFVRGGLWVPDTATNAGVPAALPITLLSLLGASAAPALSVSIVGASVYASGGAPAGATARYTLTAAGSEQSKSGTAAVNVIGTWLLAGAAASYEVRATKTAGSRALDSGSLDVWENMATTREWSFVGTLTPDSVVLLIEIRPAGGGAVLDSAYVTLEAEMF